LGEAGATVYVTSRPASGGGGASPSSLESVAREVDAAGGRGIPVRCDHAVDGDVAALFSRIAADCGRLDILVNNAHAGLQQIAEGAGRSFYELEPDRWDLMNRVGVSAHYAASVRAARMMAPLGTGLIVNVSSFGALTYIFDVAYGAGKAALDRLSADMARELRSKSVAVVSLWPGLVRTELTDALMAAASPGYRKVFDAYAESPILSGRAVAALAADPRVLRLSGSVQIAAEVAARYGLRDETGSRPSSPRSFRRVAMAALPVSWRRLAMLAPRARVPMFLVAPALSHFSDVLKRNGGYRPAPQRTT
jgi:NAD(P)-dependent dehydrogenase (short-subunit alcohol dehydrogenase family)